MNNQLESLSQNYCRMTTALTEGIQRAEAKLLDLSGRVRTVTRMGDGESLQWDRHEGEWRILYCFAGVESPLATCGVEAKAKGAKFLSCLEDDIAENLKRNIDIVAIGLGALNLFFNPVAEAPK